MDENIIAIRDCGSTRSDEAFKYLMSRTEDFMNKTAVATPNLFKQISASELEKISTTAIKEMCSGTPFRPEEVRLVSAQTFPDILVDRYYGVEVKSTTSNHWKSTGSSIVESTRNKEVERIYMLFGKLGGDCAEFRCKPYQDCLYDIAVTHSPRYLIDMDLLPSETIFSKMGIAYDELRVSPNSIEKVRSYYREEAVRKNKKEMPWWLSQNVEESTVGMNVRLWQDLTIAEKALIRAQSFILFPEVLNPRRDGQKYDNLSLWLCSYKSVVNPHVRDMFSAGGKIVRVNGVEVPVLPQVIKNFVESSDLIKWLLHEGEDITPSIKEFQPQLLNGDVYGNWLKFIGGVLDSYGYTAPIMKWFEEKPFFEVKKKEDDR